MEMFIDECVKNILEKKIDTRKLCVVLPSKRASLFVIESFKRSIGSKPIIQPELITINELFKKISGLSIVDDLIAISKLYTIYKEHLCTDETFEDFVCWGQVLLNDFDDIDKYLVDPSAIFANIEDIKEIDQRFSYLTPEQIQLIKRFWGSFISEKLSIEQESMYKVWKKLLPIYIDLKELLVRNGIGYEGLAYRNSIEILEKDNHLVFKDKTFAFIGFNALNECEHRLLRFLKAKGKALFYWDSDPYYTNNDWNEAGYFLKENMQRYPSEISTNVNSCLVGKQVSIVQCPSSVSQVKYVSEILSSWVSSGVDWSKTAVILCDETLLLSLIHSIPHEISKVNITMGFPLKVSPASECIMVLLKMYKNISKNSFLYCDLLDVLQNDLSRRIINKDIYDFINNKKWLKYDRICIDDISFYCKDLFVNIKNGEECLDVLRNISLKIISKIGEKNTFNDILRECFYTIYTRINQIDLVIKEDINLRSLQIVMMLVKQALNSSKVSFVGEPLQGLQVMGILESRVLDFENLLVLSVNEGNLPSTSISSSYIPFNLRQGYGLPTIKQRDAIYSYYFYRLLQRSNDVRCLYVSGALKNEEMSRYLSQIYYDDSFKKTITNISIPLKNKPSVTLTINKTDVVMNQLRLKFCDSGRALSAKALNTYIDCNLKFYYQNVVNIYKEEELDEIPNNMTFGNIYHKAMQNVYGEAIGVVLDVKKIELILNDNEKITKTGKKAFEDENIGTQMILSGYYEIIFNVVTKYVIQTLKTDIKRAPFKIIGLEYELKPYDKTIMINDESFDLKLFGLIDRIEETESETRIIDYKTGKRENNIKDINSLFNKDTFVRNDKVFQALFYSFLYKQTTGNKIIKPSLFFVRENAVNADSSIYVKNNELKNFIDVEEEYMESLFKLLEDIFDKNIPFNRNEKSCLFCDYKRMCRVIEQE